MSTKVVVGVVVVVLLALLICGGAGAFWYFKTHQQVADVGPLAGQALALPADVALIGGFDAKGFFASPGYKQLASGTGPAPAAGADPAALEQERKDLKDKLEEGLAEAEQKTGVRIDRDVDRVVFAMSNVAAQTPDGVMIALGRFDKAKITSAVQASAKAEGKTVNTKTVAGVSALEIPDPGKPSAILAIPKDGQLLVGTEAGVAGFITAQSQGKRPLETNASLMTLVKGVDAASGYWVVADEPLVARGQKEAGPGAAAMFPMPKNLTFAGKFEGSLMLAADMADDAAATQVQGMLDGGLAMVKGSASENPQVAKVPGAKEMVESLAVKAAGKRVTLTMNTGAGGSALAGLVAAMAAPALSSMGGSAPPAGMESADGLQSEQPSLSSEATMEPEPQAPEVTEAPAAPAPRPAATPRPKPRATLRPAPATTLAPAAPAPKAPSGPVRIGGDIREPRKIKNVNPVYPEMAKRARQQGVVILECTISAEGDVTDVKVLRSQGNLLDQAAMDAVRKWTYEPTQLNGTPVPVVMTVTVNFKLN
jgi:protein TonB